MQKMSGKKLNLGCGKYPLNGFINIDLCPEADLHIDLRNILPFEKGEIEEILAIHVIESFYKMDFLRIIKDWKRVLRAGGRLTIEFTDLDDTIKMYLSNNDDEHIHGKWGLYGDQDTPCNPLEYHTYVYTRKELENVLLDAGFTGIEFVKENIQHDARRDWRVICLS
jgi:predicted SAM-dependent methyltransferase